MFRPTSVGWLNSKGGWLLIKTADRLIDYTVIVLLQERVNSNKNVEFLITYRSITK